MTSYSDPCQDPAYQASLDTKLRFQLNNIPPTRYNNLANNPYDKNYTQAQLDMRRKAEVLKYSASKTNTKTNNLTKKQLWAQLVGGSRQQRSLSSSFIQQNAILRTNAAIFVQTCPSGTLIQTPTYASDVPGTIINLFLDNTIPLYNYSVNQEAYPSGNETGPPFAYSIPVDKTLDFIENIPQNTIPLTSISIENIKSTAYSFTIKIPVSIYIRGQVKSSIIDNDVRINEITRSEIASENNELVPFTMSVNYLNKRLNVTYDLNTTIANGIKFNVQMTPNYFDPSNNYFSANQYIGMATISNFKVLYDNTETVQTGLDTQNGYLYDIFLSVIDKQNIYHMYTDYYDSLRNYFDHINTGFMINLNPEEMNKYVNCSLVDADLYNTIHYEPFSVT